MDEKRACSSRDPIRRRPREATGWEKIFANCIEKKKPTIFAIHTELLKVNNYKNSKLKNEFSRNSHRDCSAGKGTCHQIWVWSPGPMQWREGMNSHISCHLTFTCAPWDLNMPIPERSRNAILKTWVLKKNFKKWKEAKMGRLFHQRGYTGSK